MLTDSYPEYDRLCVKHPQITHVRCWTHSRRYFIKAQNAQSEASREARDCIGSLYKVEDEIRKAELQHEEQRKYRQQNAEPLVDPFFNWHQEQLATPIQAPGSGLDEGVIKRLISLYDCLLFSTNIELNLSTISLEAFIKSLSSTSITQWSS